MVWREWDEREREQASGFFPFSCNVELEIIQLNWLVGKSELEKIKFFFTQLIINLWNSLPQDKGAAATCWAADIKRRLGSFMGK